MNPITAAVSEFLRREKEQNATPRGCDYAALLSDVANLHGVSLDLLKEGVRAATVMPPN